MKPRPPLSIDAALARIAGHVPGGWSLMARHCDRVEGTVRAWGDPDRDEQVSVDCAIVLDLLYQEHGGQGAPIFEAYALKLELEELAKFADRFALLSLAADVIKEGGEAHSALVRACAPGAKASERNEALPEVREALEPLKQVIPLLSTPEAHATGPPN
jgi:hypothetical protein